MESSSTDPSARARICTLGLVSSTPVMRSSTMPASAAKSARYFSTRGVGPQGPMPSSRCLIVSGLFVGGAQIWQVVQVHQRVARTGHALVELHDCLGESGPAPPHLLDGGDDVVDAGTAQSAPTGHRTPSSSKYLLGNRLLAA